VTAEARPARDPASTKPAHRVSAAPGESRDPRNRTGDAAVWDALQEVHDPEIPALSVLELGVIGDVRVSDEAIVVELLPTFVGCPAIEVMRERIQERLAPLAKRVDVDVSFAQPWTSARITAEGRRKLRESGFAPPALSSGGASVIPLAPRATCPFCGSRRTALENAFGPTLCRAIYYCRDCRQPFEQFKSI
jgi:ring-1,2-phenylacetyl-CoA epoxidase subunit PaaD